MQHVVMEGEGEEASFPHPKIESHYASKQGRNGEDMRVWVVVAWVDCELDGESQMQ